MFTEFSQLTVSNSFADELPFLYRQVSPQPLTHPECLHVNRRLAQSLGLSDALIDSPDFLTLVAGAGALPGGKIIATAYSGHQFGVWAGQLGDGRAHLLGEVHDPQGRPFEWQLKGSGLTPYSRMGDGRAVLRSTVREYLASEAMWGLGIPTTGALGIVTSDDPVYRETVETAAIVLRTAPSFIRFGTFEQIRRDASQVRDLLHYVCRRFYPDCYQDSKGQQRPDAEMAVAFLQQVTHKTAVLIADWLTVGFCHGVMNTDNMSVLGLTIDYGPYGFMDRFQANHICNATDAGGRYAWNAQASIGYWNLHRLAGCFLGLGLTAEELKAALSAYEAQFLTRYRENLRQKFGFQQWQPQDDVLAEDWWSLLHHHHADFTNSFRALADVPEDRQAFAARFNHSEAVNHWLDDYLARILQEDRNPEDRQAQMNAVNPVYILRNHLAQQAIEQAQQGDASEIERLLTLLRAPFTPREGYEAYAEPLPEGVAAVALSCSS